MILFFPHIPKTGGQTLRKGFKKVFGSRCLLQVWMEKYGKSITSDEYADHDLSALSKKWMWRRPGKCVLPIMGHLTVREFLENPYASDQHKQNKVIYLSVVRDPLERMVSNYNYWRYFSGHPLRGKDPDMSFSDFISNVPANFQVGYLKFGDAEDLDEIVRRIEVFPVKHSIEGFDLSFRRHFGKGFGSLPIVNTSREHAGDRKLKTVSDIDDDLRVQLLEKHAMDLELYERVCKNWDQCAKPTHVY